MDLLKFFRNEEAKISKGRKRKRESRRREERKVLFFSKLVFKYTFLACRFSI